MNKLLSSIELALDVFRAHKVRTALAALGITIGISSIIVIFSAGEGIKGLLTNQVESFGANTIQVEIKVPTSKTGFAGEQQSAVSLLSGGTVTTLKLDDLNDILELPNIRDGYGISLNEESVVHRGEVRRALIWASSASFIDIDKTRVGKGRFFTDVEDRSLAQVAVLGAGLKEELFGDSEALEQSIKVNDIRFRVIGIMEERSPILGFSFDDFLYIPVQTVHKKVAGSDYLTNIIVAVDDTMLMDSTVEDIRVLLRENHNIDPPEDGQEYSIFETGRDDFRVGSMTEALEIFDEAFVVITAVILAIVAISLVVGGVGILNVMYVIVNERTPEIGLRKAVGAKYNDIMSQFLVESVLITLVGGIVGTFIGVLLSLGLYFGASYIGYEWNFAIPIEAFVIAMLFSIVFGVLFGIYPARRAARMEPIEALRQNK